MNHSIISQPSTRVNWFKARAELLAPLVGLPLFLAMFNSNGKLPAASLLVFACAAAVAYLALVVWSPMTLPPKAPRRMTSSEVKRTAVIVTVIVVVALLLLASLPTTSGRSGSGGLGSLFTLGLIIALGTAGLAAERTLPEDLFPEVRRREFRRLFYVIAATLFLTVLTQLWGSVGNHDTRLGAHAALGVGGDDSFRNGDIEL